MDNTAYTFLKNETVIVAKWNRGSGWWFHTAKIDKVNKTTYKVGDTLYRKSNLHARIPRDVWNTSTNQILQNNSINKRFVQEKREEQITKDLHQHIRPHLYRLFKVYNQGDVERLLNKMKEEIEEQINNG